VFGGGQVGGDLGELIESSLQVFDDLGRKNGGIREIAGIAEAVVAEPEDVEVRFVALDQVFVGEGSEALGFGPLVAVIRLCSSSLLALAVGVLRGDGADQDVEVAFETAEVVLQAGSASIGRGCVLAEGFGDGGEALVGVDLDLNHGFEGLLDIQPAVFDMFQAFFRGHG
jgi:hypothetical protein